MKKFFLALVAMTALTVSTASATPVGTFAFAGSTQQVVAPGNTFTLLTNVFPDVNGVGSFTNLGTGDFGTGSQAFVYVTGVTSPGSFTFTDTNVNSGVTLQFGTASNTILYTFTTTGFAGSTLVSSPSNNAASAILLGYFTKGSDTEVGSITFSFQNPLSPSNTQGALNTSYSADATTVPEPSTYAMLGTALLGLGLLRRRK